MQVSPAKENNGEQDIAAHRARWITAGYKNLPVAINVSFAQFADANFVDEISKVIDLPSTIQRIETSCN